MSLELEASEAAGGMHRGHLAMAPGRRSNALRVLQGIVRRREGAIGSTQEPGPTCLQRPRFV